MSSPLFLDSAGSQRAAVQLLKRKDAPSPPPPGSSHPRSSRRGDAETPEQRRIRLSVTLRRAAQVAEITLADGSVASLPLCPGARDGSPATRNNTNNWARGPLRRSVTISDVTTSGRRSASYSGDVTLEPTLASRPFGISATRSMKDLRELRADAGSSTAPTGDDPRSRLTLEDKVILRLSELLSDSLLQTKLAAMGVLAEAEDEDVEWVTAGELATTLSACSSSPSSSSPPPGNSSKNCTPGSRSVDGETVELLQHAKSLQSCAESRRTLVKAAELFEELIRSEAV